VCVHNVLTGLALILWYYPLPKGFFQKFKRTSDVGTSTGWWQEQCLHSFIPLHIIIDCGIGYFPSIFVFLIVGLSMTSKPHIWSTKFTILATYHTSLQNIQPSWIYIGYKCSISSDWLKKCALSLGLLKYLFSLIQAAFKESASYKPIHTHNIKNIAHKKFYFVTKTQNNLVL